MSHLVHPPATRWPIAARPRRRAREAAGAAALLHALVATVLVLGIPVRPLHDEAPPAPIEVVMQPAVPAAPTPPVPQPPSVAAVPAIPDAPARPAETVIAAPPPPMPTAPAVAAMPPPPEVPIAPAGQQAELPPPASPAPRPPLPAAALAGPAAPVSPLPPPTLSVPVETHEPQRLREPPHPIHHEARARPREPLPSSQAPPSPPGAAAPLHAEVVAPSATPAAPISAQAAATWRDRLAAWLGAHKSYPEAARAQDIEGVVVVRFTIAHDGRVLDVLLVRSSGHALLDDATEAMLRGATVPPLPPEMPEGRQSITVPLRYSLVR